MEDGQHRFHSVHSTEPACRPLVFGTLVVMGLLQVTSSVAILLHLTGYLNEVGFSSAQQKPLEEVETAPVIADALKDPRKKDRPRCTKIPREVPPTAHLPIRVPIDYVQKGEIQPVMIQWNEAQGHLEKLDYHNGRLLVKEGGLYYIYAKTCFRYYDMEAESGNDYLQDGNAQLIQYIYHERHTQRPVKATVLMKSGSTKRWKKVGYNMYCEQQGGLFILKEGDGLFVSVSNSWMLDPEPEGGYFGAFKISN
ncbi:tumor necrosis factor ligand superfamily member 11 [Scleropages formosus]|uniref:THD domain-containing protein n=1 Tax=Scleropages formosus TaxID=113540 RepID=A0A8C9U0E1_SCLFO|nr:tumor necrosis factor ligand superfamily member 11 [Scleropages formosus]